MNTNQKNIGIGFWLAWVLASTLGFGVGPILGVVIPVAARVDGIAFPILFGAIFGVIGTLGQWMLIRRQAPEAGLWVPFSTVAFVLAVITAASLNVSPDFNSLFILAGIYGLLGGFLQSLILVKQGIPIGWWIVASIFGGLLGAAINGSAVTAVETNEAWKIGITFFWIWFGLGAPTGLGVGITTGTTLLWFSRNPGIRSRDEAVLQGTR